MLLSLHLSNEPDELTQQLCYDITALPTLSSRLLMLLSFIVYLLLIYCYYNYGQFVSQNNKNQATSHNSRPGGKERERFISWTVLIMAVGRVATVWRQRRLNQQRSDSTCRKHLTL